MLQMDRFRIELETVGGVGGGGGGGEREGGRAGGTGQYPEANALTSNSTNNCF